jgi:hypothetical protein
MPILLTWLSRIGIAAMLWVGGHILLAGADELGWHGPYSFVHDLEHHVEDIGGIGGVLAWLVNTTASAVVGLVVGLVLTFAVAEITKRRRPVAAEPAATADAGDEEAVEVEPESEATEPEAGATDDSEPAETDDP